MDNDLPVKRRRVDKLNEAVEEIGTKLVTDNANSLSVKPDKIQKLRKIAASCERRQSSTRNDDVIISSVGSSPSTSPCPEHLTALSTPVDAAELKARLTTLVHDGSSSVSDLGASQQEDEVVHQKTVASDEKASEGNVHSPTLEDVGESANVSSGKNVKLPMRPDEFKALLKSLINERMRKLEESYNENIIPSLEKKIAHLESDNKSLSDRAQTLQQNLHNVVVEYRRQMQKPPQTSVGIQVCVEPPPLTPVGTGTKVVSSKPAAAVPHVVDSIPGLHKPPSTVNLMTHSTPSNSYVMQAAAGTSVSFAQRGSTPSTGVRYSAPGAVVSSAGMYMSGQPRLYAEATYKPGSHPNAVVTTRAYSTFVRPNGPVTATVYPQPQNVPVSPTNLGVPRNSPPSPRNPGQSPPNGFVYAQQPSNGVVIRAHCSPVTSTTTQPMTYAVNSDRRGHPAVPVHSTIPPRQQVPTGQQIPPPDYQASTGRPQKSYQPSSAANPLQINGVRNYSTRPNGPPPPRAGVALAPGIPSAPRHMMVQNQMAPRAQATYARPNGPPPLVRAQPPSQSRQQQQQQQQQQQHLIQTSSPRFPGAAQTHSIPPRPQNPNNINPSMAQVSNSQGQGRAQAPGGAQVRLRGHSLPNILSKAPQVPPQSLSSQSTVATGAPRDLPPPAPNVSISAVASGIVLSWNMSIPEGCAQIDSYQLFAYQNTGHVPHSPSLWKKLGIVKALPLPMACTLTQFVSGSVYHFAVRAIDIHGRAGNYSAPRTITLPAENGKS